MFSRAVKDDTLKIKRFWITKSNGLPIDLSGLTARARWRINGGTEKIADLSIVAPASAGLADLLPASGNWDAAGTAVGRVELLHGSSEIGYTFRWYVTVEPRP